MDRIETRLRNAAEETRERMRQALPEPPAPRRSGAAGWLVLATAFAAVLLVFSVPLLLGGQSGAPVGQVPEPTVAPPTTAGADSTTTSMTGRATDPCSATGVPQPELAPDLPPAVAATARAIVDAASDCSFDRLAGIAATDGTPKLITSFGGGGVENLARWEEEGDGEMDTLVRLFGTSHTVTESDGPEIYVWPAAFAYDSWEDIPREHLVELIDLGVYTEGEIDEMARFDSYAGWRIGIDENGEWLFFIAGD